MKYSVILFILVFFIPLTFYAQCYQLVWADEFNGSSLDLTKWTPIVGPGGAVSGNNELQYYTNRADNIQVSNGTLKIIAKSENYGGNAYTSARMETRNLGDWLYGRIEGRIKLPVAQGMWPAFWMMPTDNIYGIWPRSGEMDIMELIGRQPSRAYGTIHTSPDATVHSFGTFYNLPSGTFADDFHVFSMEWSPNLLRFFVDGNLYFTANPTTVSPYPWVYDKRFYCLLNLAIGGDWAGAPDGTTTFPQQMEVDYVRVYQKLNDISIAGKILVEPNTPSVVYSVPAVSGVTYQWTVSGNGNNIVSGQGTSQITVNWGSTSGSVSVLMNDGCSPSGTVTTPVTVSPNLWSNPNFEQNYVNWDTRPAYSSTATFSISTSNVAEGSKSACVQVNTVGANPWNIQLSRTNLNLIANTSYTLRFKAKADVARTIPVSFIRTSDFGGIAAQSFNLTTSWQSFSMTFTPSSSVNAMCNADLAAALSTYCFDDFIFGKTAIVIPVELMSFQGTTEGKTNRLTWLFAEAKDLKNVEIQKSMDGKRFTPLSIFTPNTLGEGLKIKKDGEFIDENPFSLTYYRLKINDINGSSFLSKTIALSLDEVQTKKKVFVSPNPVQDFLDIQLDNLKTETVSFDVFNAFGQLVFTEKSNASTSSKRLNTEGWSKGVYFLKLSIGQSVETVHFIKK